MNESERGASLVELIVGVMFMAVVLLSLAGSITLAARTTIRAQADMTLWAAVQWKADSLVSVGYGKVTDGSETVQGYPMRWRVSGTNPQRIDLVVQRQNLSRQMVQDTVVLYLASPS